MNDDSTPATKGDLRELERTLRARLVVSLKSDLQEMETRILHHFDLTVETIRHDLLGANHDEIEAMKDRQENHERRISTLERSAGLVTN